MIAYLRRNHLALIALFIALGGTSYAAIQLPPNSVGSKQIRKGAVTPKKLSRSTVKKLKGARGPQGPAGTVDTSNFYDKAASDSRFLGTGATAANSSLLGGLAPSAFVQGDAKIISGVETPAPGGAAGRGTSQWDVYLECPNPLTDTGSVVFENVTDSSVDLFIVSSAAASPVHFELGGHSTWSEPFTQDGDVITFDAEGFPGSRMVHVETAELNRTAHNDCLFQMWALDAPA